MTTEDARSLYDRLRETEAQTREQNERLHALSARVDSMLTRWDNHMAAMWKLVYVLVGAVLALALGPKLAEKVMAFGSTAQVHDIAPWHHEKFFTVKYKEMIA